jgi:CheY-like chemotaxis protein
VKDGEEALGALESSVEQSDAYHVILMDYQMPGEDGLALTRRIQSDARFGAIPVIMLSSIDTAFLTEAECGARFAAQLAKPLRPSQLMDLLASVLADGASASLARAVQALRADETLPPAPGGAARASVLIAEDNLVNQLVAKNMIAAGVYELHFAENGVKAVELFLKQTPDIILMDVSMPVMDGFEAAQRIRLLESERRLVRTPIVAVTAHVLEEDRARCRAAGMDDFLSKPIRKSALDEILNRWSTAKAEAQNTGKHAVP